MNFAIEMSFIYGFALGIEYMDLDPTDSEDTYLLGISLGFIRICFVW
jgi:hypothetical protein